MKKTAIELQAKYEEWRLKCLYVLMSVYDIPKTIAESWLNDFNAEDSLEKVYEEISSGMIKFYMDGDRLHPRKIDARRQAIDLEKAKVMLGNMQYQFDRHLDDSAT